VLLVAFKLSLYFRVKELGVSGSASVEQKAMDVEQTASNENVFELTNDEDFALLRNSVSCSRCVLVTFDITL